MKYILLTYRILLAACFITYSATSYSQTKILKSDKIPSSSQLLPPDPSVKTGKLPNGFTYYIRKNTEPKNRAHLYLVNQVGSILEKEDQRGLAHFLEHMGFNGTKNYPKNNLVGYLQKAGVRFGADLNAYTNFDETVYQLPIPTDDADLFRQGIQIMRDWAQDLTLDTTEIEKERGVVLEEKRLRKGAGQRMQEKYLPVLLNRSHYADRFPIGTEEVLKNFKSSTLKQFYKDWYRPNLQALIVVGDIDMNEVEQMVISKFSDLKNPTNERTRTKYNIPFPYKNQFIAITDEEFPSTVAQILIKHPEKVVKTVDDLRDQLVKRLYNQMLNARFSELTKQADPPFIYGGSNIGSLIAGLDASTSYVSAKPGELEKGFKTLLTEIERSKRFGFRQTELDRAKITFMTEEESTYKERDKTNSGFFVNKYLQHFLRGEAYPSIAFEYNFYKKNIDNIKLSEINLLAKKYITDSNRDVIILAPEKDKNILPNEKMVNQWIERVKQEAIKPYDDQILNKPLLSAKPTPGKIVAEKTDTDLVTTELTLSNGVKVVLKPTDFKSDEISFGGVSAGGSSLYSDADYQSASNAANIVSQSGLGEFNSIALNKFLMDKKVYVSPSISERSESIMGYAIPKNIETALQLVYLYFTSPRKDNEIFTGFVRKAKANLANRNDDPASVFADSVAAVLSNYNIRRTGPSLEKIDQINLNRAYDIYKERFANARNFTFTFVGNIDIEKIKPLLELYLGSLPSTNQIEEARDLGIKTPTGKINKTVYKGQAPKAIVRLVFSGNYTYTQANNNQLDALAEVLTIKLIERLRETEGGVYGVGARASYSKYPQGRYTFNIAFGCAPENVDKLVNSALDEINKIKQNGAQEVDVQKFIAEETRTTETQLKENSFWLSYLYDQQQNNEDPRMILSYLDSLKSITPQSLKEAANTYTNGDNFIKLVLLPQNNVDKATTK